MAEPRRGEVVIDVRGEVGWEVGLVGVAEGLVETLSDAGAEPVGRHAEVLYSE